jgi:hypothetical protein
MRLHRHARMRCILVSSLERSRRQLRPRTATNRPRDWTEPHGVPLASMTRFDGVRPVMWVSKRSPANRPRRFSHGRALLAQFVAVPAAPMLYARATRLQRRK